MGLLTDFYNTVAKFFRPQEIDEADSPKTVATNRLKLVLMQDRTNLTPKILEQMRGELVDLLSKYLEMDKDSLELNFEHEGDQIALMLSIPVIRAKDEEEIEEALRLSSQESEEEPVEESFDEDYNNDEFDENNQEESMDENCNEGEHIEPDDSMKHVTSPEGIEEYSSENVAEEVAQNSEV